MATSVYSPLMRVDLHVHTYPASRCSSIAYRDLIAHCRDAPRRRHRPHQPRRRRATTAASRPRSPRSAPSSCTASRSRRCSGDFIVYSPDLDYLAGFATCRRVPRGRHASPPTPPSYGCTRPPAAAAAARPTTRRLAHRVAPLIDAHRGVERQLDSAPHYVEAAARALRTQLGLPGRRRQRRSRARRASGFAPPRSRAMCGSTADVVAAIKAGAVAPVRPEAPQDAGRGVGRLLDLFRRSRDEGL